MKAGMLRAASVAGCVMGVSVAACTSTSGGIAQPTNTGSEAPVSPTLLSPPIRAKQLDLTAAKVDPCGMVPVGSLVAYGVTQPGTVEQIANGPSCRYNSPTVDVPLITVSVFTTTGGLEGAYKIRNKFSRFVPGTLRGYPTVSTQEGAKQSGICNVIVAVNDRELIDADIDATGSAPRFSVDPCNSALGILTLALQGVGG